MVHNERGNNSRGKKNGAGELSFTWRMLIKVTLEQAVKGREQTWLGSDASQSQCKGPGVGAYSGLRGS